MKTLPLLASLVILSAVTTQVTSVITSAVTYSDTSCSTPVLINYANDTETDTCTPVSCSDGTATVCPTTDWFTHSQSVFGTTSFILAEVFDNTTECSESIGATAIKSNTCVVGSVESTLATLATNGSILVEVFEASNCSSTEDAGGVETIVATADESANHSCVDSRYKFYVYASSSNTTSSTNSTKNSTSTNSANSRPLSGLAGPAAVIVGVLFASFLF